MQIGSGLALQQQAFHSPQNRQADQVQARQLELKTQRDQINDLSRQKSVLEQDRMTDSHLLQESFQALHSSQQQRHDSLPDLSNLPRRQQQAIQTFVDNLPSVQEQLGVELAGIDTFA